jgi:hypothetical protein
LYGKTILFLGYFENWNFLVKIWGIREWYWINMYSGGMGVHSIQAPEVFEWEIEFRNRLLRFGNFSILLNFLVLLKTLITMITMQY